MLMRWFLPEKSINVMAFDFGMSRIGVAIGDSLLKICHPIAVISGKNKFEKLAKIRDLVNKWQPALFVVGTPKNEGDSVAYLVPAKPQNHQSNLQNMDSYPSEKDKERIQLITNIKRFSNRLQEQFKLKVEFVNEEYSSLMAASKLNEQAVFARQQKDKLDAVAATIILQRYFDEIMDS